MSSNEERKEPTLLWDKYTLHFTVIYSEDARWAQLAAEFRLQNQDAGFIVHVTHPYFIPIDHHYVAETIDLTRPKPDREQVENEDKWETLTLRTRIFRFERVPTKSIVPPVSLAKPAQPYAEIRWTGGAVSSIEIKGLENLVPRGGGVAAEAKRLGDAADILLRLSMDALRSPVETKSAKTETEVQVVPTRISPEEKWLALACPGAKAVGLRGEGLTRASLAQELKLSEGTITNRRRDHPESWAKIEAAHAEGMRQRLTSDRK